MLEVTQLRILRYQIPVQSHSQGEFFPLHKMLTPYMGPFKSHFRAIL